MTSSGTDVLLRAGTDQDANAIADIWHRGWHDGHDGLVPPELVEARTEESFTRRARAKVEDTTVAVVEGEIAGFVLVADDEVELVFVSSAHRGTGVAPALIRAAERQVGEAGYSTAWLAVVAGNARARAFYERSGWVDEGPFTYDADTENGSIAVPCHRYVKDV